MTKYKKSKIILLCILNSLFLYYLYKWFSNNISLELLLLNVKNVSILSIWLSTAIGIIILVFYALRTCLLLKSNFGTSFGLICIGFGSNNILPFRLGELVKMYYAKKEYNLAIGDIIISEIVAKWLDLTVILLIGLTTLFFGDYFYSKWNIYILLLCSLLFLCIIKFFKMEWLSSTILFKYDKIVLLKNKFTQLMTGKHFISVCGMTLLIWTLIFFSFFIFFEINLPNMAFGIKGAFILIFVTTLTSCLPGAPANFGLFEAAIIYYLVNVLSIEKDYAVLLAVFFHLSKVIPQILFMCWILLVRVLLNIISRFYAIKSNYSGQLA